MFIVFLSIWRDFGNIKADEFTYFILFFLQNEMLCTTNIIVFSLANSFYNVIWSGIVPRRWLRHNVSSDNTIGEQFPQEK